MMGENDLRQNLHHPRFIHQRENIHLFFSLPNLKWTWLGIGDPEQRAACGSGPAHLAYIFDRPPAGAQENLLQGRRTLKVTEEPQAAASVAGHQKTVILVLASPWN